MSSRRVAGRRFREVSGFREGGGVCCEGGRNLDRRCEEEVERLSEVRRGDEEFVGTVGSVVGEAAIE